VVLMASAPLFLALRLAGAAYLVYLGIRTLARLGKHEGGTPARPGRARRALAQGFLSNLSNAKMVAFFVSLLPPFAGPRPSFALLLLLGLNFSLLTLAWLAGYAAAVERLGTWLQRSSVRRGLDAALGAVLVGLGLKVGADALAST
jgi:threonine/homoserine/homoserine lactone efflux protein